MNILEISQTIFYFTVSFALLFLAALLSIVVFETIIITKNIKNFFGNLNDQSAQLYKKIDGFFEGISRLPFISTFFSKKSRSKKK